MVDVLNYALLAFLVIEAGQMVLFLISCIIKNPTMVDLGWAIMHFVVGCFAISQNKNAEYNYYKVFTHPKPLIGFIMIAIWVLRLGGFIFYYRIWRSHSDPRYKMLAKSRRINETLYSLFQFIFQGVMILITSTPLFYLFNEWYYQTLYVNHYIAILICILALFCEAQADNQLQSYKDDHDLTKPRVFRGGWFKHARHPNLFFELTFWFGIACYAFNYNELYSLLAFIGPLVLFFIMTFLTVPVTTNYMLKSRDNYEEVIKETNMYWPFCKGINAI